jgi:SEC-C motif
LHGAAGEEELLAFYLQEPSLSGFGSLAAIKQCSESSGAGVRIPEGEWKAFEKSEAYKIHCSRRKRAAEWMEILKRFDAAIIEGETGEANHVPLEIHEDTLRAAASENLASRALLAREWQDKFSSVPHNIRSSRLVRSLNVPGRIYVFLFVPWIASSNSYEQYREFRLQMMHAYAQVLRLNAEWAKEAIILATEPAGNSDRRSETMLRVVYENPMTPEEVESARHLMHAENILNLVVPQSHKHPVELTRRVGRNDPCPCASGKKNKHCCEIRWLPESTVYMGML